MMRLPGAISIIMMMFVPAFLFSQQTGVIFGKVTDSTGKPVFNANITLPEHEGGTTSSKEGKFEMKVPANKPIVVTI